MKMLLETTEKFFITDEEEVNLLIEEYKEKDDLLIDHKVSLKETKTGTYYIVTLKVRSLSLAEAKESV